MAYSCIRILMLMTRKYKYMDFALQQAFGSTRSSGWMMCHCGRGWTDWTTAALLSLVSPLLQAPMDRLVIAASRQSKVSTRLLTFCKSKLFSLITNHDLTSGIIVDNECNRRWLLKVSNSSHYRDLHIPASVFEFRMSWLTLCFISEFYWNKVS